MSEQNLLPDEIWQKTPPEAQALLLAMNERLAQLEQMVAKLQEQLALNSQNSSKPPSSDGPKKPKKTKPKKKSRRKRGGQVGHKGSHRKLLPLEEVDALVECKPTECKSCQHPLVGEDPAPQRHQVAELPPIKPTITEYQLHQLTCLQCGEKTRGKLPQGVSPSAFGPRVEAFVALLSGAYFISRRAIRTLMDGFFGLELSVGSVCAMEKRASQALAGPVQEAKQKVKSSESCGVDETGFRQSKKKGWLWTVTTSCLTVFRFAFSRGSKVVKELLGANYYGVVHSDRWSAYNYLDDQQRQICWAHLKREFERWKLRGDESEHYGEKLLEQVGLLFKWYRDKREGNLSKALFGHRMKKMQKEVGGWLELASECEHPKTAATARNLLQHEVALWTFVYFEEAQPSNNWAERALRPAVIWRKRSFGADSEGGSRFVERILSVVYSLKQQKRDPLEYVTAACQARRSGQDPPSLLPPS